MKAARLHGYGQPLVVEDVPTPIPGPGQVLLRIVGAGFCHSDVHVIEGEIQALPRFPVTLGHENAGVVAAVGAGVASVREGDAVAVYGGWGCRRCDYCVSGHEQLCESPSWVGLSAHDGGYADFLLVPQESYLVPLGALDPRNAAPLTDAALTPYRAIKKALGHLEPDHFVLVVGAGGLGLYGIRLLRLLTGCRIVAVDVAAEKLAAARESGAELALDGRDAAIADRIRAITSGKGVCASFDFVGSDSTLALACRATRSLGKVTQIGLAGGTARLQVLTTNPFEVQFESTLWGTIKELREVIALAETGRLQLIPVEFAPLEAINDVHARVKRGQVTGRIVLTPGVR